MAEADLRRDAPGAGLIVLLPASAGALWRWWPVRGGTLGDARTHDPEEADRPWGELDPDARVVALVPAADCPVRIRPRPELPLAQALAAARLEAGEGSREGLGSGVTHVAVAAGEGGRAILVASVATAAMDLWLAELATAGLTPDALVPVALVLPSPGRGAVIGELGDQVLARTPEAAFAGEPELVAALAGEDAQRAEAETVRAGLLAAWREPPLDLRQGAYAPRRVAFFLLPDWLALARMAAVALLLGFLILAVETVKLQLDAGARERAALAAAQRRFPAAVDLASAQALAAGELARRGVGAGSFTAPAAAVLGAMRPIPSLSLRDLGYASDGTLRFQAAAPTADAINRLLTTLQQEGWRVTVPPQLAADATGATVAAITVRAP